jgi:ATP-dependent helicase/nuclease subunit A
LTHHLLEILPDLLPDRREAAAKTLLERQGSDIPAHIRDEIARETLAILSNPAWAALFGPGSMAEVSITGLSGTEPVSGQIDRLVVTDGEILIVDYKTNRPPPADEKNIPAGYRRQMQLYSDIVANLYKNRRVRAFLLWTDGPRLMEVDLARSG